MRHSSLFTKDCTSIDTFQLSGFRKINFITNQKCFSLSRQMQFKTVVLSRWAGETYWFRISSELES